MSATSRSRSAITLVHHDLPGAIWRSEFGQHLVPAHVVHHEVHEDTETDRANDEDGRRDLDCSPDGYSHLSG